MGGDPISECRRCQPFRKCREETIKAYRKEYKIKGGDPNCLGQYSGLTPRCEGCKVRNLCRRRTGKMEHIAQVEHEKVEEDDLLIRLRKKVKDQWGGPDVGSD